MVEPAERVFVYIRMRVGDHVVCRTKIRELAGLGTLLADLMRTTLAQGLDLPEGALDEPSGAPVMEYVCASTERPLIAFRVDLDRQAQVIEGTIPAAYRRRMLDPEASAYSPERFVERAAPDLAAPQREALAGWLARPRHDLLGLIRGAIDADGRFEVVLPLRDDGEGEA